MNQDSMNSKLESELFAAIIKSEGINFRGVSVGDSLETVVEKEGTTFTDRGGSLPNYKYFFEIGEMEELILVYAYRAETKTIYNLELTLKTYPKHYWREAGGTDLQDFYQQTIDNKLGDYIEHFTKCKELIIAHFENQIGAPEVSFKHNVFKHAHQNFSKHTWISGDSRLVLLSHLDDTKEPEGATTMELTLMLSAV